MKEQLKSISLAAKQAVEICENEKGLSSCRLYLPLLLFACILHQSYLLEGGGRGYSSGSSHSGGGLVVPLSRAAFQYMGARLEGSLPLPGMPISSP